MATGSQRILIVEDSMTDARIFAQSIESENLGTAEIIHDGVEGLAACFHETPDLLILDLELPRLRGEEICRMLRSSKRYHNLPILIVSELPDAKRREMELLHIGADFYLQKPFQRSVFLDVARRLLGQNSSVTEEYSDPFFGKEYTDSFDPGSMTPPDETPSTASLLSEMDTQEDFDDAEDDGFEDITTFQDYRILGVLGFGGMGTVYKAQQIRLQRAVALKVLLERYQRDHEVRKQFEREALIMAQISHQNIVQVFDFGSTDYTSFLVMELINGQSLETRIHEAPLTLEEVKHIVDQATNAIIYLHRRGIIHRDIKPGNILISRTNVVKVTDFGLSRARLIVDSGMTGELRFVGTHGYVAPELFRGKASTEKSDQFAFGMTIWRMLVGNAEVRLGTPLKQACPNLAPALIEAVDRCLHPIPSHRFPSMEAARTALLKALDDPANVASESAT